MKKTIITLLITLLLQITLQARVINIDNIIDSAKKTDKHLFLWLHKTDCGYCENMREFTLENETIKAYIDKNFIFVHLDVYEKDSVKYQDFRGNGREFALEVGYNFYPASLFFDETGDIVFVEIGFIDNTREPNENRFYKILNFIQSKSYEEMNYSEYKFDMKEEL